MTTREDIARLDKIHARADHAHEQIKAGHIITECQVLYPEEGKEIVWKAEELSGWKAERDLLLANMRARPRCNVATIDEAGYTSHFTAIPTIEAGDISPSDQAYAQRGHAMYRQSAAYIAMFPPADPHVTKGDRAGDADRG